MLGSSLLMRSFAIEEPGSPVPALYATLPHCANHLDKGHMQPQERVDLLNLLVFSPGEGRIASVVPKTPRLKIHVEGYKLAVSKKSPG